MWVSLSQKEKNQVMICHLPCSKCLKRTLEDVCHKNGESRKQQRFGFEHLGAKRTGLLRREKATSEEDPVRGTVVTARLQFLYHGYLGSLEETVVPELDFHKYTAGVWVDFSYCFAARIDKVIGALVSVYLERFCFVLLHQVEKPDCNLGWVHFRSSPTPSSAFL